MKLVINTAHQRFGGAVQVALSFINECRHFSGHEFHVWVGPGVRKSLDESAFPDNFHFYHFDFGEINFKVARQINRELQALEDEINPDVIIATSGPSYFHSKAPQIIGFNLPLYIYPESPYVQGWGWKTRIKMKLKKVIHFAFFKRDAAAYVVQTDDVNQRVRKALHTEKVFTVTNTSSSYYNNPPSASSKLPQKKPGTFRFLTLSAFYPHKNLELIPEVARLLEKEGISNVEFALTLPSEKFKNDLPQHPSILNAGPVRPEEGPALYRECDGMFLPTLAECFSASYPEAMKMEKPIVTTDLGFARSICGEAALYYQAKNAMAAVETIKKLVQDTALQQQLVSRGRQQLNQFDSAKQRAYKYLSLCQELADHRLS